MEFAKNVFSMKKNIWCLLGITSNSYAAGGKCRVAPKGPHIGIAYDIELNNEGKKHKIIFKL